MDGFKSLPKMAHFKEGGSVKSEAYCGGGKAMKKGGDVSDVKQDKAMIKKAFKQHDKSEHDKEPTEIKLKNGGRSKKASGTVRKFKTGGSVVNTYEAKKSSGDKDNIKKVKDIKPSKATASSKAAIKPAFKGSDIEKEKSKPAGDAVSILKVKPTGDKKANARSGAKGGPNRYAEGGEVIDMRDNKNNSISDDVRARAMKFLETGKKDSDETPKSTSKPAPKSSPKAGPKDTSDQNDRRAKQFRMPKEEPGLESVNPEDYITGGGILKGMLKGVVRSGEKAAAKEAAKRASERAEKAAAKEAKDNTRRDAEGYSPEEAVRKIDEPARKARTESSGAMKDTFKPEEIREGFKKGGKIKKLAPGGPAGDLLTAEIIRQKNKKDLANRHLSPDMQNQLAQQQQQATQQYGQPAQTPMPPVDQMGAPTGMPMQKRGGRVGKK